MSEHEDGRELSGAEATSALERVMPKIRSIHAAQQELVRAGQACLQHNGGPINEEETVDGESYVMVRLGDFEALQAALEQLGKARAS
ncbi:MAG: hypothetical protein Q8T13_23815 [Acidobacteriota bacterium]|nr:hypothetical protein [Acidobacteriota bacterium]